jgi:hypothetical protein
MAVEGMGQRRRRVNPFEAVIAQGKRLEERRRDRHRINRRTHVVQEPGKGERLGSAAAADRRLGFVDDDPQARAGEHDRRREAVRTGADNDRIWNGHYSEGTLRIRTPMAAGSRSAIVHVAFQA